MDGRRLGQERDRLAAQIAQVGPFRRGSVQELWRKCGKAKCHCAKDGDPGHGPKAQWTRTVRGANPSRGQAIPEGWEEEVRGELGRFADFQRLVDDYVEVNEQICVDRAKAARAAPAPAGKKRGSRAGD
jgi:hypothetical protein